MDRDLRFRSAAILLLLAIWQQSSLECCFAEDATTQTSTRAEIDAEFNKLLFDDGHPDAESLARFRMQFMMHRKLQHLVANTGLSEVHTQKILRAGHGDIARACDRIQTARRKYHELASRPDEATGTEDLDNELLALSESLISPQGSLLGEDSLFAKSCNTILPDRAKLKALMEEPRKPDPLPRGRLAPFIEIRYLFLTADPRRSSTTRLHLKDLIGEETRPYVGNSRASVVSIIPRPATLSAQAITIEDSEDLSHVIGQQALVEILGKAELRSFENQSQLACVAQKKAQGNTPDQLMAGCEVATVLRAKRQIRLNICLGMGPACISATGRGTSASEIQLQQCELIAGSHELIVVRGFRLARSNPRSPAV